MWRSLSCIEATASCRRTTPWVPVRSLDIRVAPDIISFDAHKGLEMFFADPVKLFTRWLAAASLTGDPQELAQHAMITATCGLGLLEISSAVDSFHLSHGLSKLIRNLAGVQRSYAAGS
jgi:hypothetical protein